MPIYNRFDEVQGILKDASNALGSGVLSGIIAHITSDADFLDADLDLYHFFVPKNSRQTPGGFRKLRRPDTPAIRFFMTIEESAMLVNTLTERLSAAYESDRNQTHLRQYYVANLSHKLAI